MEEKGLNIVVTLKCSSVLIRVQSLAKFVKLSL